MAYGIMNVQKQGRGAVFGLQIEANRNEKDHENGRDFAKSDVDWNRTSYNYHLVKTDNWQKAITGQIHEAGVKERKDSNVLITGLFTASPEWFEGDGKGKERDYFEDCLDWYVKEYCKGDASRVINAVVHMDEATPHMQVASVPIFEDEKGMHLAAKNLLGGRGDMRKHQDHFFEEVSKEYGLERGEVRDWVEIKKRTEKREWQIAEQEKKLAEQSERAEVLNASIEATKGSLTNLMQELDKLQGQDQNVVKRFSGWLTGKGVTQQQIKEALDYVKQYQNVSNTVYERFGVMLKALNAKAEFLDEQERSIAETIKSTLEKSQEWQEFQKLPKLAFDKEKETLMFEEIEESEVIENGNKPDRQKPERTPEPKENNVPKVGRTNLQRESHHSHIHDEFER